MANSRLVPRLCWADDFGDRAFWFDAFVSHNRTDSSESLVHRLRAAGTRVSSDHDGAQQGWKFPTFLFAYLSSSRSVVIHIGQQFPLSPWIRAEINVVQQIQTRSGLDRLLIALSDDQQVPAELADYPQFDVSTAEGLHRLVGRLVELNRLPAEMLEAGFKLRREESVAKLGKAAQALRAKLDTRAKPDPEDESRLWWLAGICSWTPVDVQDSRS